MRKLPAPDKASVARAWDVHTERSLEAYRKEWGHEPPGLATWIVNGPYHPFWSWWMVSLIHLRDVEGAPTAEKRYPGAEYELMILSLNPTPDDGRPRVPDIAGMRKGKDPRKTLPGFLTPPDLVYQFDGVSDREAVEICETVVDHIVAGQSCDSDFRRWWTIALGETVAHYHEGVH